MPILPPFSPTGFTNIAEAGTTAEQWSQGSFLDNVMKQAPSHDEIWVTLMGNDALEEMPGCARTGKNASACGDELMVACTERMTTILDAIHSANPSAKVVGFGYDIMFGGLGFVFDPCFRMMLFYDSLNCALPYSNLWPIAAPLLHAPSFPSAGRRRIRHDASIPNLCVSKSFGRLSPTNMTS